MNALSVLMIAECQRAFRNRWVISAILLLAALAFSLALLGSTPIGDTKANLMSVTTVSLASLSLYLIPLLALTLSFDAIVGEVEQGTLLLLLSYPVKRWQVLFGKFFGHTLVLALAIGVGYGSAGIYLGMQASGENADWMSYALMMGSSLLLGMVFVGIGLLVSLVSKVRATAIGLVVAIWLLLLVVYDFALLGLAMAGDGSLISQQVFEVLLLLNPADVYRIYNLTGSEVASMVSGLASMDSGSSSISLLGVLLGWVISLLLISWQVFQRKEL